MSINLITTYSESGSLSKSLSSHHLRIFKKNRSSIPIPIAMRLDFQTTSLFDAYPSRHFLGKGNPDKADSVWLIPEPRFLEDDNRVDIRYPDYPELYYGISSSVDLACA